MKFTPISPMAYTLEQPVHFLSEQRTEPYKGTVKGVAQLKNVLGAKSDLQDQTWFGLGRRGV
jgi:hypothetical protein